MDRIRIISSYQIKKYTGLASDTKYGLNQIKDLLEGEGYNFNKINHSIIFFEAEDNKFKNNLVFPNGYVGSLAKHGIVDGLLYLQESLDGYLAHIKENKVKGCASIICDVDAVENVVSAVKGAGHMPYKAHKEIHNIRV